MDIVLFGVGQYTDKFINIIHYFGKTVSYLADNDKKKAGETFHGIKVISPELLIGLDCKIIVSCIHWKEIGKQLSEMGIGNRLISLSSFLKLSDDIRGWDDADYMICMDLYSKAKWGGAENWNIVLAKELAAKRSRIAVTGIRVPEVPSDYFGLKQIEFMCFPPESALEKAVAYYRKSLPLVFVNSFYGENFFAAMAVKRMEPHRMRIINVVHNDRPAHYNLAVLFDDWIDQYLCVSSRIKETLVYEYGIPEDKVSFLHQPVDLLRDHRKNYNVAGPLRLGIASRLTKEQKRCDLIPELIRYLEDCSADYVMSIAGDGELSEPINDYIKANDLSEKVRMLGYLGKEEMNDFWKGQDVYINISEYEGTSLSMLEAMGSGCVPLVTDVSGVRDYISDGYSGFVFDIGDLRHIAEKVRDLSLNRSRLQELGSAAKQEVFSKCNAADYACRLIRIVEDMT